MRKLCFCLSLFAIFYLSATEKNPVERVNKWIGEEKLDLQNPLHTFVTLATVNRVNQPTTRLVELISLDDDGALFFTHRNSRKAQDLSHNLNASMNLWLPSTHRQVSMEGPSHSHFPRRGSKTLEKNASEHAAHFFVFQS